MLFIDARKYRRLTAAALYTIVACAMLFITYRAIQTRVNTFSTDIKYKEYSGLNGTFTYKMPANWKVEEQKFGGGEVMYHSDFWSEDRKVYGYVEVWNLNKPLIDFIKQGQKSAVGIISFKYYTIEPVKINGRQGYILQYSRKTDGNKYVKAFEVFIMDEDSKFHRFAFYMDEQLWKDEYRDFFLNIAASAKLK